MGTQISECAEIAQKVFREDPYAENKMIVEHITNLFGGNSQYELEKVKGPKKLSLIKAKVWPGPSAHAIALPLDMHEIHHMRAALRLTPAVGDVHAIEMSAVP